MRITIHIPDRFQEEIKRVAVNEKRSMSSLVSEAVEYYIKEKKKREMGTRVLEQIGKSKVSQDALSQLQEGRKEYDRA